MPERFLVTIDHHDVNSTRLALGTANALCLRKKWDAVICVPNKQQAPDIALNEVIPKEKIKRMLKGEPLVLNGVKFWLESIGTLKRSRPKGVIIALYIPLGDMKKVEETGCKAIVYLPWMPDERDRWRDQWNPEVLPPDRKNEDP